MAREETGASAPKAQIQVAAATVRASVRLNKTEKMHRYWLGFPSWAPVPNPRTDLRRGAQPSRRSWKSTCPLDERPLLTTPSTTPTVDEHQQPHTSNTTVGQTLDETDESLQLQHVPRSPKAVTEDLFPGQFNCEEGCRRTTITQFWFHRRGGAPVEAHGFAAIFAEIEALSTARERHPNCKHQHRTVMRRLQRR